MKYELQQNLGLDDARYCNDKFGAGLETKADALAAGSVVDLSEQAVEYLTKRKQYTALLVPAGKVKGVTSPTEVKGT